MGRYERPFQPIELKERVSYECLKIFAETQYPFVVSTKGRLIAHPEYLDLLARCNCVVQVSMVCSKYDKLEPGTPSYEERLEIVRAVAARVKRVIVRIQPYMPEVFNDVMANIPRLKEAGVYGIVAEGMKFAKAKPGMVRIGGDSATRRTCWKETSCESSRKPTETVCGFSAAKTGSGLWAMICAAAALRICPDSRATITTSA